MFKAAVLLMVLLGAPVGPTAEQAWEECKRVMSDQELEAGAKKEKLEELLLYMPVGGPNHRQVRWWIDQLNVELETTVLGPQELRTKTEFFGLQLVGGGYYGYSIGMTMITIRWEQVYWELVQVRGSVGNGGALNVGTVVGYHLHLGDRARHEFRFGAGVAFGAFFAGEGDDEFQGLAVVPQASYLYHISKHFAFETVLAVVIAVVGDQQGGYPIPSPALTIGFRF